jgi:hypothetical protein
VLTSVLYQADVLTWITSESSTTFFCVCVS